MSIWVGDDGQLEPADDDLDPARRADAEILRALAIRRELDLQVMECHDDQIAAPHARIGRLEATVAMLERLITG